MKKIFNTLIFLVLGCVSTLAGNILKIAGQDGTKIHLIPGLTNRLEVVLDNDDPISSLQFDVKLPDSRMYIDEDDVKKVTDRITRSSHSVKVVRQKGQTYRFGVLTTSSSMETSAIKGNSGAILTFDLNVPSSYTKGNIEIINIVGSNGVDGKPVSVPMDDQVVEANVCAGHAGLEAEAISLTPNTIGVLNVTLENNLSLVGLEAKITLPEGVSLAEDMDGEVVDYTNRLSDNISARVQKLEGNTYKLLISSISNDVFKGNDGVLFGLKVKADNTFKGGDVVISNIKVASVVGDAYDIEEVLSCTINYSSDPSGDGVWDARDIVTVVDDVLNGEYQASSDVNGDGVIDARDISAAANKILND